MKLIVGSDDAEHETAVRVLSVARELAPDALVAPSHGGSWVDVGFEVAEAVAGRSAHYGIVCCYTGTGVSMAANKVPGVRAALCSDAEIARGARLYNDANVLALSLLRTSPDEAEEMIRTFLSTPNGVGEDREEVEHLTEREGRADV
jgi:ribose 5-phosphate isomerase B